MTTRASGAAVCLATIMIMATVSCGEGGTEPETAPSTDVTPTTGATPTTEVPATIAPVTTETTSTSSPDSVASTSTVPEAFPHWSTACVELLDGPGRAYQFDERLGAFTTLGAAPNLDLTIPAVVTVDGPYGALAATTVIPGGVLVGIYPPNGWPTPETLSSSSLVAVDHTGSVRWRRCFDDIAPTMFAVAPAGLTPTTAWVVSLVWDAPLEIIGIDLTSGIDVPFPIDVSDLDWRGSGERFIVLAERRGASPVVDGDLLTIVDLLDGTHRQIPYPPTAIGEAADSVGFTVHDVDPFDDDVTLIHGYLYPGEVRSVYVEGSWADDPDTLRDALPPTVTATFGEPFELHLLDGAGDLIWAVPNFHSVGREGFHWVVADDVVLAVRCTDWDADGFCGFTDNGPATEELVGFDITTGHQLWTLPGYRAVPIIDGNRAIMTFDADADGVADDGYALIDLLTGERIDGVSQPFDSWPIGAFAEECCGGDDYVHVALSGAVAIATNEQHIRVWYPHDRTTATVSLDLIG